MLCNELAFQGYCSYTVINNKISKITWPSFNELRRRRGVSLKKYVSFVRESSQIKIERCIITYFLSRFEIRYLFAEPNTRQLVLTLPLVTVLDVRNEVYAKWESKNEILPNITHTQWNHIQCMCRCRYHWCPPYLLHPGDIPACWCSQRNPRTHRFRRRSPLNSHTGTLSECSSLHPTYTWNSRSDRAEMKTNTHYPNNYLIIVGNRGEGGHNNGNQNGKTVAETCL